ncbi:MAG TPA: YkgJ family cysteine cluster protein [Pseudomonadota bacterium]|nr:YkgJ family cysteine cluster protein [Pseudomonadota bacterium]
MPDTERLSRICTELASDPRYAGGSKRFALAISDAEAMSIAEALAEELDEGVAARAAQAARQGFHIYCQKGCTACCAVLVVSYLPEALRIAAYLNQPEHADAKAAFLAAYPRWKEQAGNVPERATAAFVEGRQAEYDALHLEHFRRAIPCAFLVDGACSIYPVRPLGCRNAHALDTAAQCVADPPGGRPPAAVDFVPLTRLIHRATQLLHAVHNVKSRQRHGQQSVCVAVYELLTRPARR